jgi:hypothetical protein
MQMSDKVQFVEFNYKSKLSDRGVTKSGTRGRHIARCEWDDWWWSGASVRRVMFIDPLRRARPPSGGPCYRTGETRPPPVRRVYVPYLTFTTDMALLTEGVGV